MLSLINGKNILDCNEDDLLVLIDNEDYRENEYIDYKQSFSFLDIPKGKEREIKKTEYKNDVCSFANTEGGYLIFGISENKGCASSIEGIEIPNNDIDRFELDRRNDLNGIQPKVPPLKFSFIKLNSGKYVVVIYIRRDGFSPYMFIEDEKNYKAYRRFGNRKRIISYTELRQMFNTSLVLEQSINKYTNNRIDYYQNLGESFGKKFAHIMFIPETFLDYSYRNNMYVLEQTGKVNFYNIFKSFRCINSSIPCVDGIRFIPDDYNYINFDGYIKNNGVVEACISLDNEIKINAENPNGFLPCGWLWTLINQFCFNYIKTLKSFYLNTRIFICLSIVGCRDVITDNENYGMDYIGKIDRDEVICEPIEYINKDNSDEIELIMKKIYISYMLAIGVKNDDNLKKYINEVYGKFI